MFKMVFDMHMTRYAVFLRKNTLTISILKEIYILDSISLLIQSKTALPLPKS